VLSTGLEYCWYHRRRHRRAEWKTQPGKGAAATTDERWVWGLPALDLLFPNRQTHLRYTRKRLAQESALEGGPLEVLPFTNRSNDSACAVFGLWGGAGSSAEVRGTHDTRFTPASTCSCPPSSQAASRRQRCADTLRSHPHPHPQQEEEEARGC